MKKRSPSTWRNYLDDLTRQAIRKRGKCERCGSRKNLQVSHIYTRTYKETRWMPLNLLLLCASCHFWGHRNPILFTEFVREHLGEENYEKLKVAARKTRQWFDDEYLAVEKELKEYQPFVRIPIKGVIKDKKIIWNG